MSRDIQFDQGTILTSALMLQFVEKCDIKTDTELGLPTPIQQRRGMALRNEVSASAYLRVQMQI